MTDGDIADVGTHPPPSDGSIAPTRSPFFCDFSLYGSAATRARLIVWCDQACSSSYSGNCSAASRLCDRCLRHLCISGARKRRRSPLHDVARPTKASKRTSGHFVVRYDIVPMYGRLPSVGARSPVLTATDRTNRSCNVSYALLSCFASLFSVPVEQIRRLLAQYRRCRSLVHQRRATN